MNKKTITTILAVIGALATVAALLYIFRDKLAALCKKCTGRDCELPETAEDAVEAVKEAAEDAAETVKQTAEAVVEDVKDTAKEAEEKAAAIAEEFKDYADVELPVENIEE